MIDKIKIENLTVFENLEIDTSAPINVFIGENGTGKTQILKFIYILCEGLHPSKVFLSSRLSDLIRAPNLALADFKVFFEEKEGSLCLLKIDLKRYTSKHEDLKEANKEFMFTEDSWYASYPEKIEELKKSLVFIPAKDMLTHSKGLPELSRKFELDFDRTYIDIIEKSRLPKLREIPNIAKNLLPDLEKIMNGKVKINNDRFYIKKHDGRLTSFNFEAEGVKKIGLLWQLLMNETITEDTILLWDEPDANLNPNLAATIAHLLLELSRSGVKIFLSTHSYFLPKYLDLLERDKKEVVFHSLYRENDDKNSPVICETSDTFSMLTRNSILGEIVELFEREMEWE